MSLLKFVLTACIVATACAVAVAETSVRTDRSQPAPPDTESQRRDDLVLASRILFNEGVLDSFGHVSVRSLNNPKHFFMPRAMPPALVTAKDLIKLDGNAEPIVANSPRPNGEKFIHAEIYKVRPDVQAIVHSHSPGVIPFSLAAGRPLRPVIHTAGFLPERVSVFDIRSVSKDDPDQRGKMLINNAKLGAALARSLANDSVALIRGHGNVVVGESLPWAVLRAVYTEANARTLLAALTLGQDVTYLDPDEIQYFRKELFPDRPWANFITRLPKNP